MDKFENLQTSSENKQHYIPMEVTAETIKDFGINPADVVWTRIGNRKARVIMIPATEEQYKTFMRPLWREDKRQQRQEPAVSLDKLYEETEYEVADTDSDLEADVMKKMLISFTRHWMNWKNSTAPLWKCTAKTIVKLKSDRPSV